MVGGGPFGLEPGQWTDDTSMALCLAESLVERQGFDARDQMERYVPCLTPVGDEHERRPPAGLYTNCGRASTSGEP